MSTAESSVIATELGLPVPDLPHAVSVSLPTWQDNLGYAEGEKRVVEAMTTGYPRFVIHRSIQLLARTCEERFGNPGERCILVSTARLADACQEFLTRRSPTPITVRTVHRTLSSEPRRADDQTHLSGDKSAHNEALGLHAVFFPAESFKLAKSYWQYTGHGISSRRADRCVEMLGISPPDVQDNMPPPSPPRTPNGSSPGSNAEPLQNQTSALVQCDEDPLPYAEARLALQKRIARALEGNFSSETDAASTGPQDEDPYLADDDVFLYPGGMNAIWHAHQLILQTTDQTGKAVGKSICFGFPYTDTLKILEKWGPGCYFFGAGVDGDLAKVRRVAQEAAESGAPIAALFCEVSTNPLLRTPNMVELRKIADEFDFLVVVDETIGNFVNVDIMEYSDIVVTSLTKVFSGRTNVMGGSLVLNPRRRHYTTLRDHLQATYEDLYWHEDVVHMELNSRHFAQRIDVMNRNAEAVADWLWQQSAASAGEVDGGKKIITNVFFPKWVTRENYDACRRRPSSDGVASLYPSGFGSLFTILFTDEPAARAFYDNLGCEKGPTWGTNFTLACPYTILAHYCELDWAAEYGVPINIVRISVGMEDEETILGWVKYAYEAAEKAARVCS